MLWMLGSDEGDGRGPATVARCGRWADMCRHATHASLLEYVVHAEWRIYIYYYIHVQGVVHTTVVHIT